MNSHCTNPDLGNAVINDYRSEKIGIVKVKGSIPPRASIQGPIRQIVVVGNRRFRPQTVGVNFVVLSVCHPHCGSVCPQAARLIVSGGFQCVKVFGGVPVSLRQAECVEFIIAAASRKICRPQRCAVGPDVLDVSIPDKASDVEVFGGVAASVAHLVSEDCVRSVRDPHCGAVGPDSRGANISGGSQSVEIFVGIAAFVTHLVGVNLSILPICYPHCCAVRPQAGGEIVSRGAQSIEVFERIACFVGCFVGVEFAVGAVRHPHRVAVRPEALGRSISCVSQFVKVPRGIALCERGGVGGGETGKEEAGKKGAPPPSEQSVVFLWIHLITFAER